jgi:hypothetical protein
MGIESGFQREFSPNQRRHSTSPSPRSHPAEVAAGSERAVMVPAENFLMVGLTSFSTTWKKIVRRIIRVPL